MKKNNSFFLLSSLIAVAAIVLPALNVEFTASVVFAAGLVALLLGEYTREIKPLPVATAPVLPIRPAFKLAA